MSEYRAYNLTLTVVDPSARDRFRALSRPESFFEIRPNRSSGQRGAYSVAMTQDEYEAALEDAANPNINLIAIEPNQMAGESQSVPGEAVTEYAVMSNADSLGLTGAGVDVGVAERGYGSMLSSVFGNRVKAVKGFGGLEDGSTTVLPPRDPYGPGEPGFEDHGASMAGLAVPPGARIVAGAYSGSQDGFAAMIYWMVDEIGVDIISCSQYFVSSSTVLQDAVAHIQAKDILFFASAGNGGNDNIGNGENFITVPASYGSVHAISNYRPSTDSKASTSNYGSKIWAAAPGAEVYEYGLDGSVHYTDDGGTSAAAAVASGIAARFMTGGRSPGNVVKYLADNARATGASPLYEGAGVLQLAAAEQQLQEDKPDKIDLGGATSPEGGQDGTGNPDPGACGDKSGFSSPTPAQYRLDVSYYGGGDPDWGAIRTCLLAVGWTESGAGVTSASGFRGFGGYGDDIVVPPSTVCAQALSITAGWTTEEFQVTDSEGPITTYWLVPPSDWEV